MIAFERGEGEGMRGLSFLARFLVIARGQVRVRKKGEREREEGAGVREK